ncbi:hypothetical protein ACNOYE_23160 [Nannocystaceae bacterium ST9]
MQRAHAGSSLGQDARRRVLWGLGLMVAGAAAPALATVLACSPRGVVPGAPVAAEPSSLVLPEGPPTPTGGLPMPDLDVVWSPPSPAAGDPVALAEAIARHPRIGLIVDPALVREREGQLDRERVGALINRLAPDTAVHVLEGVELGEVVLEDPPLVPVIADNGRVHWSLPESLAIDRERARGWADRGDPAVLVVGAVGIDGPTWRSLGEASIGGCDPLEARLLDGQTAALTELEPFLDHADAVLAAAYQAELAELLPKLEKELAEFAPVRTRGDFRELDDWNRYECGEKYRAYLEPFASCIEWGTPQACSMAPRLFLRDAARIGSVEPAGYLPSHCPARLGRDYVEELRTPARKAAELAGDVLDVHWLALAERLATLSEVHGALEQLCEPTRRRFAEPDVAELQTRLVAVGELFQREEEPPHDARFLTMDGSFHVPGVGAVRQLARFDGGTGSASRALVAEARGLARFARERARCVARPGDPPVMMMLIESATAKPEFLGFFHSEELDCGELGPLR